MTDPRTIAQALSCGKRGCLCALAARRGAGVSHCPAHEDSTPSLSVSKGKRAAVVVHCHGSCAQNDVVAALKERGLWGDEAEEAEAAPVVRYEIREPGGRLVACRHGVGIGAGPWEEMKDAKNLKACPCCAGPVVGSCSACGVAP